VLFEIACVMPMLVIAVVAIRSFGLWTLPCLAVLLFTAGFGIRVLLLRAMGTEYVFRSIYVSPDLAKDLALLSLVALIAMFVGILIALTFVGSKNQPTVGEAPGPHAGTTTIGYEPGRLLVAYLALTTIQFFLLGRAFGGGLEAFTKLSQRTLHGVSIGLAVNLSLVSLPILLLATITVRRSDSKHLRLLVWTVFAFSLPWIAVVNSRATVVVIFWCLAMALRLEQRKPTSIRTIIVASCAVVATAVVGLAWRRSAQTHTPFHQTLSESWSGALMVVSDSLPLFDHLRAGMAYAAVVGHDNGASLLTAFTVLVPRSLWPDKPSYLPERIAHAVQDSDISGLPAGLLGEGFLAFSWPGVLAYSFLFGLLLGALHRRLSLSRVQSPLSMWVIFLAASITLGTLRTGAQGGLITAQAAVIFLPVIWAVTRFTRAHGHPLEYIAATAGKATGKSSTSTRLRSLAQ
jgi:hypothetical protein